VSSSFHVQPTEERSQRPGVYVVGTRRGQEISGCEEAPEEVLLCVNTSVIYIYIYNVRKLGQFGVFHENSHFYFSN